MVEKRIIYNLNKVDFGVKGGPCDDLGGQREIP